MNFEFDSNWNLNGFSVKAFHHRYLLSGSFQHTSRMNKKNDGKKDEKRKRTMVCFGTRELKKFSYYAIIRNLGT